MGVQVDHPGQHDPRPEVDGRRRASAGRSAAGPANAMRPAASTTSRPSGSWRVPPSSSGVSRRARIANGGVRGRSIGEASRAAGPAHVTAAAATAGDRLARTGRPGSVDRGPRRERASSASCREPRSRWAVHSEPPRSIVAELPCQPQVQVIVWAWCLYSSMTCLNGSIVVAGLTGGTTVHGDSCGEWASPDTGVRGGALHPTRFGPIPLAGQRPACASVRPEVIAQPPRQPADLAQEPRRPLAALLGRLAPDDRLADDAAPRGTGTAPAGTRAATSADERQRRATGSSAPSRAPAPRGSARRRPTARRRCPE